ncbi:MAG: hypothetical protein HY700_09915 [Gemmatimonadetes bacterium]|nr:hypothetical protein [Gemmatimonadota bacterium]
MLFLVSSAAAQTCYDDFCVTPVAGSLSASPGGTNNAATFTIWKGANRSWDANLSCLKGGQVTTCTVTGGTYIDMGAGTTIQKTVNFNVSSTNGSGYVQLKLTPVGGGTIVYGKYNVTVGYTRPTVIPDGGATTASQNSYSNPVTFTVTNNSGSSRNYTFTCAIWQWVNSCTPPGTVSGLANGASTNVTAYYNVGSGNGSVTLVATESGTGAIDDGLYNVTTSWVAPQVVTTGPMDSYVKQDMSRCNMSCYAATYSQSTVPYLSLNTPRNVTLVYHGDRVDPKPFIIVDVRHPEGGGTPPQEFWLEAQKSGGGLITFLNGETRLKFVAPSSGDPLLAWVRIGGQFDAAANGMGSTGKYELAVIVTSKYSDGTAGATTFKKLIVVNENNSAIARGWTVAGIQRLYAQPDGSALITEGDGSAVFYQKSGSSFTRPAGEFADLLYDGSNWFRKYPDSTTVWFDSNGRMASVNDRFLNMTWIYYDGSGRIQTIRDPQSLDLTLSYGTNGLSQIADPFGRSTTVNVDGSRRLTEIRDPDNIAATFGYDGNARLSTITDRRGKATTLAYDDSTGKVKTITYPAITIYPDSSNIAPVVTLQSWQKQVVPSRLTGSSPFPPVTSMDNYSRVTDAGGHVTKYYYEGRWGVPARIDTPLGKSIRITRTSNGQPTTVRDTLDTVDPAGLADTTLYNSSGLPTYLRPKNTSATNIRYAAFAEPDSIWGTDQPTIRRYIGANGRVASVRVGGSTGTITKYTYDWRGRVLTATDGMNHLLTQSWYLGGNGNLNKDSMPGGRVNQYVSDVYGRDSVFVPAASTLLWPKTFYDILNRPTSLVNAPGTLGTISLVYGDSLHLTRVTDPNAQVYEFGYNSLGWLTSRKDPTGTAETLKYDRDGLLKQLKNRRNQNIDYGYDPLHRLTSKSGTNTQAESWAYASNGRVVTATSPVATVMSYLNARGQEDSVKNTFSFGDRWLRYGYNSAGMLTSAAGPASARSFAIGTLRGSLDTIYVGGTLSTALGYNADLRATTTSFWGGDVVNRSFSTVHDAGQIWTSAAYQSDVWREMEYDVGDRLRLQKNIGNIGAKYGYDATARLNQTDSVTTSGCYWSEDNGYTCNTTVTSTRSFGYDSVGNRRDLGGAYTTGNRITAFNSCTYGVADADGNVSSRTCGSEGASFWWSAESRLDSLAVNGQKTRNYYDAYGRLAKRDVNGTIRYYAWDEDHLGAELDAAGATITAYSYYPGGTDGLESITVNSLQYMAHSDALGNVIALTNVSTGPTTQRTYVYDEWGKLVAGTDPGGFADRDRARWKGALWFGDVGSGGLYYMRNRWYEPHTGRFLSEDPVGLEGGINPYAYATGDPVNGRDPTGLADDEAGCDWTRDPKCPVPLPPINVIADPWYRAFADRWSAANKGGDCVLCRAAAEGAFGSAAQRLAAQDRTVSIGLGPVEYFGLLGALRGVGGKVVAGRIAGFTKHGLNQAISRDGVGVSSRGILDAVRNPLSVVAQAGGKMLYIGQDASVVLNQAGLVVTTWARTLAGWRIRP